MVANRFGQRAVANLPIEHLLELGVAARDGVADDDQVEVAGDVLGAIAAQASACLRRRESRSSADTRPGPIPERRGLCASASRRAWPSRCRRRQSGESRSHSTAASSITSRGDGPRDDARARRQTAASSPGHRVARRKSEQHRSGKIGEQIAPSPRAPVGSPPGSSHRAARRSRPPLPREQPGLPQLRDHPIETIRPLADLVEKQHAARRRIECKRRAHRGEQLRQRAAEQHARASPRESSRGRAPSARPSARRRHSARSNESAS